MEWEDEGIAEHASELLFNINKELGEAKPEEGDEDEEVEAADWEDVEGDSDDDEEMKDT